MPRPAVFLDRDGVINQRRADYVKSWSEFEFLPGALEALARLAGTEAVVIVITNQSAVGRGLVSAAELHQIHRRMMDEVAAAGGRIERVYACIHTPEDRCACRKPAAALLLQASLELDVCLTESVMIGDSLSDVRAGQAAGCLPILLQSDLREMEPPDVIVASDLSQAVDLLTRSRATALTTC